MLRNRNYSNLHSWVRYHKGRPIKCEHCGVDSIPKGYKRYFHWANKSHEYKESLDDWISLCLICHSKYDHKEGIVLKRNKDRKMNKNPGFTRSVKVEFECERCGAKDRPHCAKGLCASCYVYPYVKASRESKKVNKE